MCLLISYRADAASLQERTHTKRYSKKKKEKELRTTTHYLQQQTRSTSCWCKEHPAHNLKPLSAQQPAPAPR